jgi:hypothetical protein
MKKKMDKCKLDIAFKKAKKASLENHVDFYSAVLFLTNTTETVIVINHRESSKWIEERWNREVEDQAYEFLITFKAGSVTWTSAC